MKIFFLSLPAFLEKINGDVLFFNTNANISKVKNFKSKKKVKKMV